jgi:hypothetical protein
MSESTANGYALDTTPIGMLLGDHVLITGVEDDPTEPDLLRVYIGPRYEWRYVLVGDPAEQEKVRRAWGYTLSHLTMARPDHYYVDEAALAEMRARHARDRQESLDIL